MGDRRPNTRRGRWLRAALLGCLPGLVTLPAAGQAVERALAIVVRNPLAQARANAVLVLPLRQLLQARPRWRPADLRVYRAGHAGDLPVQPYASDGQGVPDQLLVLLDMPAAADVRLQVRSAPDVPVPSAGCLQGRNVPERADDFAWENARVGYRIYGPALQAAGEISSGIDVWSKRPSGCALDRWYRRDAEGQRRRDPSLSYHRDDGVGLDSYPVGRSPGDGGTAGWFDGAPVYSANMTRARVVAAGPVRLRIEVDYAPWRVGKAIVREHKTITLDAGSHMNRQVVRYRVEGAKRVVVVAGVAIHSGASVVRHGNDFFAVWDVPQRVDAGRIGTAVMMAPAQRGGRLQRTADAAWLRFAIRDGERIAFASGSAWSLGDMPDFPAWTAYLQAYRMRWKQPLRWRWQQR